MPLDDLLRHRPGLVHYGLGFLPIPGHDTWDNGSLWAFHLYDYPARVDIDGEPHQVQPGTVTLVSPQAVMRWHGPATPGRHIYALFAWPRHPRLRVQHELGASAAAWWAPLEQAAAWSVDEPLRASLRLWEALWNLRDVLETAPANDAGTRPLARRVRQRLDQRLADRIDFAALAGEFGVSPAHLCRSFRAAYGESAGAYQRRRRAELARSLLRTTRWSVAAIAEATGAGDLRSCARLLRRSYGAGPRELRRSG